MYWKFGIGIIVVIIRAGYPGIDHILLFHGVARNTRSDGLTKVMSTYEVMTSAFGIAIAGYAV